MVKPVTSDSIEAALDRIATLPPRIPSACWWWKTTSVERSSIIELLGHDDIEIEAVGTGDEALKALLDRSFDCLRARPAFADMSGFELLNRIQTESSLKPAAIVVFTGKDLTRRGKAAQDGGEEHRSEGCAVARAAVRRERLCSCIAW
jgi:CheY-like chemotaxis protein